MKVNVFLITLFSIALFYGCNEQKNPISSEILSKNRDRDCGYCDEIKYEVIYSPVIDGCCKATVNIKSSALLKDCGQELYENGILIQNISQDPITLNYNICNAEPIVIRVNGFDETTNDFTKVCFEERLTCATCCDKISFEAFSCGKQTDDGCCTYNYKFTNDSDCSYSLFDPTGLSVLALPPKTITYKKLEACTSNPASLKYYVGKSADDFCKEVVLSTDCQEVCSCGFSTINIKQGKKDIKGCCRYAIYAQNKSTCTQYLFDSNGNVLATLTPGQKFQTTLSVCTQLTLFMATSPDNNACTTCASTTLKCVK